MQDLTWSPLLLHFGAEVHVDSQRWLTDEGLQAWPGAYGVLTKRDAEQA